MGVSHKKKTHCCKHVRNNTYFDYFYFGYFTTPVAYIVNKTMDRTWCGRKILTCAQKLQRMQHVLMHGATQNNPRIARLFLQTSYAKRGVESAPSVISARHVKNKTDGNTV